MLVISCLKAQLSYERVKSTYEDFEIENNVQSLEELKQKLIFGDYDIAIIDKRLWWFADAQELFEKRDITVHIFDGDFDKLDNELSQYKVEVEERIQEDPIQQQKSEEDDRPIRYIEKEKIVYKERTVEVPVIQSLYAGMANCKIGIINITPRAGASFVTMNLARALSSYDIMTAVVEPPKEQPYYFITTGLEQRLSKKEVSADFYSYPHEIAEGNILHKGKETIEDGIIWIIPDPRRELIEQWDEQMMFKLLYANRTASITIVDLGSEFNNHSNEELLKEFDIILAIIDPLPSEMINSQKRFEDIYKLMEKGYRVELIINKFNPGVKKNELSDFLKHEPTMYIPSFKLEDIYEAIYDCKLPYDNERIGLEFKKAVFPLLNELVPEQIKAKSNDSQSVKKKRKGLFNFRRE